MPRFGRFTPGKTPGTDFIEGWVGVENLLPTGILSPDLPDRRESLYRLNYPGPLCILGPRSILQSNYDAPLNGLDLPKTIHL
jgi:hypothetical protein